MELKISTTASAALKGLHFDEDGTLLNSDEEVVDLMHLLKSAYSDTVFDISVKSKTEDTTVIE